MVYMDWLWFKQHGFSPEEYAFATGRDFASAPPLSLSQRVPDVVLRTVPVLSAEQASLATAAYSLTNLGTKVPPDWERSRLWGEQPELSPKE
jgi:hypothetical protein